MTRSDLHPRRNRLDRRLHARPDPARAGQVARGRAHRQLPGGRTGARWRRNSAPRSRWWRMRAALPICARRWPGRTSMPPPAPRPCCDAAARGADLTIAAIVGCAGLAPTMAAIRAGRHRRAGQQGSAGLGGRSDDRRGRAIRRHAAAGRFRAQCDLPVPAGLPASRMSAKITLTASGGPFRDWSRAQLDAATPAQAVKHPELEHGRQDQRRFRHDDEQGPRIDRGASSVPGRARPACGS